MKKMIVLAMAALFSTSLLANSVLTVDVNLVDGAAVIRATNTSGVNLKCDYKVNWRTSLLDLHRSWGTVTIEEGKTAWIVIEDEKGLPVTKATPKFECSEI